MGIGMLVLYAALAAVGLWLVAELLLQNRAPLPLRGLALGGFALVVAGMAMHSVPLIGAGAAGFAAGQVLVTRAVKRGGKPAWSLRRTDDSLPGPLAKVPLLAAATSGAEAAAEEAAPRVGEVGPIEVTEPLAAVLPEPEVSQLPLGDGDYGIYETAYQQPADQQSADQQYGYGQPGHQQPPYQQQGVEQQQPDYGSYQQPAYQQPSYEQPSYEQQAYGYYEQQQPQPQYQGYEGYQGYEQQQWQAQPTGYEQGGYQPDYGVPGIPQQPTQEYYQQFQPQYDAQQQYQSQAPQQDQPEPQGGWQNWQ
jgi:hypothetical protein